LQEGKNDLAMQLLKPEGLVNSDIQKELSKIKQRHFVDPMKLRYVIRESRNIYGVCDRTSTLKYGECFVRVTVGNGEYRTLSGLIFVSKNPCYLLGDIRVLRAIDSSYLAEKKRGRLAQESIRNMERDLIDCIVFPVLGDMPHSVEIAGSDLDGDQYTVCWDSRLIPTHSHDAYPYPGALESCQGTVTPESMIKFFSEQNRSVMGKIDYFFGQWCDLQGAGCDVRF
jgi:hypothetical protein